MSYPDNPHFMFPFSLSRGQAAVIEQDDPDEILACCEAIINTPRNTRLDLPGFGLQDQVLKQGGANSTQITDALRTFEPRVDYLVSVAPDAIDGKISNVKVGVRIDA